MLIFSKIVKVIPILISIIKIKLFKKRIPLYCEWEITSRCNMRCSFCSTWTDNRNSKKDISTKDAISIIDQLAELGTKIIHFSGGEPTLREDLSKLISYAQSKKILVALTTNGSASNEITKKIANADIIRVSIDGPEKFHDNIRQCPGAYKKAISSINVLKEMNKNPQITTVYAFSSSKDILSELVATAKELNVKIVINIQGVNINLKEKGSLNGHKSNLYKEYMNTIAELRNKFPNTVLNCEPIPAIIKKGGLDKFGCRVMDVSISIKSDGNVSLPCTGLSKLDFGKASLKQIFYSQDAIKIAKLQGLYPECTGCVIKCMCSASSLLKLSGIVSISKSYIKNLAFNKSSQTK